MKFHIIRSGETIDKIMFIYSLTKDELVQNNKHIRNWNKLVPGTKIKIPIITEAIDQDILDMEPFIEEYYPKKNILFDEVKNNDEELDEEYKEVFLTKNEENIENNNKIQTNQVIEEDLNNNKNVIEYKNKECRAEDTINLQKNIELSNNLKEEPKKSDINKNNEYKNIKKEAKPLKKCNVRYYPYYYFNPYYGQYFLYYYPIYEKLDKR